MDSKLTSSSDDIRTGEISNAQIALTRSGKVKATWKAIGVVGGILLAGGGLVATIQSHMGDKSVHLRETERQDAAVVHAEIRSALKSLAEGQIRLEARLEIQGRDIDMIRRDLAVEIERHKQKETK